MDLAQPLLSADEAWAAAAAEGLALVPSEASVEWVAISGALVANVKVPQPFVAHV